MFRLGGTNHDLFSLQLFYPRHLPCPRALSLGASLFAQQERLPINSPSQGRGKYWGKARGGNAKAVLLFEVLKVRHQEVLLF